MIKHLLSLLTLCLLYSCGKPGRLSHDTFSDSALRDPKDLIVDRVITKEEAESFLIKSQEVPLVINDEVVAMLNKYLSTPYWRRSTSTCLRRKKNYQEIFDHRFQMYQAPEELTSIAFVESCYRNFTYSSTGAAGVWMFMPETAKEYGLVLADGIDERMDVDKLTDAAVRFLLRAKRNFSDWYLAILTYNSGHGNVKNAMKLYETNDPWTLVRKGFPGDPNYLAKVIAFMIIMQNPDIINPNNALPM